MKRLLLWSGIVMALFISCDKDDAPNTDVPSLVLNSFQTEFANAADVEWEEHAGDYEVEFEIEDTDHAALLNANGEILKWKQEMMSSELPEAVISFLETEYADNKIDDVEKLTINENVYYQIEFEGLLQKNVVVDESGNVASEIFFWE